MILVWNDAKSFKRHLEAMKMFRHSHYVYTAGGPFLRDMPAAYEIGDCRGEKPVTFLTDSKGNLIYVPIWKIPVPRGSQN